VNVVVPDISLETLSIFFICYMIASVWLLLPLWSSR